MAARVRARSSASCSLKHGLNDTNVFRLIDRAVRGDDSHCAAAGRSNRHLRLGLVVVRGRDQTRHRRAIEASRRFCCDRGAVVALAGTAEFTQKFLGNLVPRAPGLFAVGSG